MKKNKILTVFLIFVLTVGMLITKSIAATAGINLKLSRTQVEKGDTFTITLSASSSDGINGVNAKYSYDENALELTSIAISDSTKFANLGVQENKEIVIIANTATKLTDEEICVLTFKVKDTATANSTTKITLSDISVDTNAASNSEVSIDAKEISVSIAGTSGDNDNNNSGNNTTDDNTNTDVDNNTTDDNQNSNTNNNTNSGSDNNSNTNTNSGTNSNTNTNSNRANTNSNQSTKTNNTINTQVSNKILPKTGTKTKIITMLAVVLIIGTIFTLGKYKYYKNL